MSIIDDRDYELAVQSCHVAAEHARLEAEELYREGFELVPVVGLASVLWRKDGRLYTTEAALAMIWAIKEDV